MTRTPCNIDLPYLSLSRRTERYNLKEIIDADTMSSQPRSDAEIDPTTGHPVRPMPLQGWNGL